MHTSQLLAADEDAKADVGADAKGGDEEAAVVAVLAQPVTCRFVLGTVADYETEGTVAIERQLGDVVSLSRTHMAGTSAFSFIEAPGRAPGTLVGVMERMQMTPEGGTSTSITTVRAWRVLDNGSLPEQKEPRRRLHPSSQRIFRQMFPENVYYLPLPDDVVAPGDSWEGTALLPLLGTAEEGKAVVTCQKMDAQTAWLYGVITPLTAQARDGDVPVVATVEAEFDLVAGRMRRETLSVIARHETPNSRMNMTVTLERRFSGLRQLDVDNEGAVAGRVRVIKSILDAMVAYRLDAALQIVVKALSEEKDALWQDGWAELRQRVNEARMYESLPEMEARPAWTVVPEVAEENTAPPSSPESSDTDEVDGATSEKDKRAAGENDQATTLQNATGSDDRARNDDTEGGDSSDSIRLFPRPDTAATTTATSSDESTASNMSKSASGAGATHDAAPIKASIDTGAAKGKEKGELKAEQKGEKLGANGGNKPDGAAGHDLSALPEIPDMKEVEAAMAQASAAAEGDAAASTTASQMRKKKVEAANKKDEGTPSVVVDNSGKTDSTGDIDKAEGSDEAGRANNPEATSSPRRGVRLHFKHR